MSKFGDLITLFVLCTHHGFLCTDRLPSPGNGRIRIYLSAYWRRRVSECALVHENIVTNKSIVSHSKAAQFKCCTSVAKNIVHSVTTFFGNRA